MYTIKVVPRINVEKFSFNEPKIEKIKFFTQSSTKIFCINVFDVGGCLESCLNFNVRPLVTWLLIKKTSTFFS